MSKKERGDFNDSVGKMGKVEMKKYLVRRTGITPKEAGILVDVFIEGLIESIIKDGKANLPNFGSFKLKISKARIARNPRTGEVVHVPERKVLKFKTANRMKKFIR